MVKPLLNLVNHSLCQFDLVDTVKLLPNDWPLPTVRRFVINSLRAAFNRHHQSSMGIVLSLSQLERLKKQKRELSRKPIRLGKDRYGVTCRSNQSAFFQSNGTFPLLFLLMSSASALSATTPSLTRGSSGCPLLSASFTTFAILPRETSALEPISLRAVVRSLAISTHAAEKPTELLSISVL